MIEEISEVNSRKGWNLTPGGSQKPRAAHLGGGRKGRPLVHWSTSDKPTARKRENKGRQVVLSSANAPPRGVLGKASYFNPSFVVPSDPQEKRRKDKVSVNKTRCHQKWRDGKARPRPSGPVLTPHREESTQKKVPHFDLSTVAPRDPRIKNGNEGQVLYGILLSNEQLFVRQWPKGQIKKVQGSLLWPRQKTPHQESTREKVPHLPSRP